MRNTYHAADILKMSQNKKNVNIWECHDHNWNHHEKCIEISASMASIGLEIPEITSEFLRKSKSVCMKKTPIHVMAAY